MLADLAIVAQSGAPLIAIKSRDIPSLVRFLIRDYSLGAINNINLFNWDYIGGLQHATLSENSPDRAALPIGNYTKDSGFFLLLDTLLAQASRGRDAGQRVNRTDDTAIILVHGANYLFSPQAMNLRTVTVLTRAFQALRSTPIRLCFLVDSEWNPGEEISNMLVSLEDPLPTEQQLESQLALVKKRDDSGAIIRAFDQTDVPAIAKTLVGLPMTAVERIAAMVAKSFSHHREEGLAAMRATKLHQINRDGLVRVTDYQDCPSQDDLVGMEGLRTYMSLYEDILKQDRVKAKGIVLLGPPGTGKTHFALSMGRRFKLPVIEPQLSQILSVYQSQSEKNWAKVEQLLDSQGECVIFMDEINRIVPRGDAGNGSTDAGRRLLGQMLNYFASRKSNAILIGSANSIKDLDPAFTRAGRIDAVFMVDTPNAKQSKAIWCHYLDEYGLLLDDDKRANFFDHIGIHMAVPMYREWTGAEIKQACSHAFVRRIGYFFGESEMGGQPYAHLSKIITAAKRYSTEIVDLRRWACDRTLCAETGGVYSTKTQGKYPSDN